MAIIKQYHKDTDTTYVYESTSYWDPEKKQARSDRKCIGKIDPVTGEYNCLLASELPQFSEDGLTAIVKLREGISFHNGTEDDDVGEGTV